MAKQTITVRLDEDDLAYLSSVELSGAANLSEKIRALLAEARAQREGMQDPVLAYDFTRRLFAAPERSIREAEMHARMRSELIARISTWLPEISAIMLSASALPDASTRERAEHLKKLERSIGERALSLVDSVLQMSLAGFPGCYEPETLAKRAQSAIRTATLHSSGDTHKEENRS